MWWWLGTFGGVHTGSSGGGCEGNMVVGGMSGKVGGIAWQVLRIRKRQRGDKNEKSKGTQ